MIFELSINKFKFYTFLVFSLLADPYTANKLERAQHQSGHCYTCHNLLCAHMAGQICEEDRLVNTSVEQWQIQIDTQLMEVVQKDAEAYWNRVQEEMEESKHLWKLLQEEKMNRADVKFHNNTLYMTHNTLLKCSNQMPWGRAWVLAKHVWQARGKIDCTLFTTPLPCCMPFIVCLRIQHTPWCVKYFVECVSHWFPMTWKDIQQVRQKDEPRWHVNTARSLLHERIIDLSKVLSNNVDLFIKATSTSGCIQTGNG